MSKAELRRLCEKHLDLSSADIAELVRVSEELETSSRYEEVDVFIDIFDQVTREAVVVYHKRPVCSPSLYQGNVVGLEANKKNEPGVYRTMTTSLNSMGLYANSQEQRLIKQTVYPIRNDCRTIGVLIVEEAAREPHKRTSLQVEPFFHLEDAILADEINEELLVFDNQGILIKANRAAHLFYQQIGYIGRIQGLHYDNLALDSTTYDFLLYQLERQKHETETVIKYDNYHLSIKKIWTKHDDQLMMIIRDVTDIKNKEAEIISKSVAILEIHHRVKNNLQSVVSLLRIQARRVTSEEAKIALQESINRMLVIAQTHEMLSMQVEDALELKPILTSISHNIERLFTNIQPLTLEIIMTDNIYLNGNQMVSLSLVINEILQNVYEHAYPQGSMGRVIITVKKHNQIVDLTITDFGCGYNTKTAGQTSLGLMIIKSYVSEKLKGKLSISSGEKGTTTHILFKNTLEQ
ncbi:sensor histidine kinase [Brochothrix thermosphacta]|uniref:histidine kinase n=2 Tax=Brochothrix thermosphacta TaxID=2756 RepID=A0A1D2KUX5_BROTH|nr:sensor histidine kinase [Brochothrix thermosphacta]ATF24921.1 hypothetical protein CNY62_00215 [Brochothrix thermosphacta]ATH84336.1 hypothetical protein CPF12_00215 [Brochothrix thermosphacta]MPQ28374.1 hypothetical protein [Brochothrix thermosphacta]ODJ61271.1 hypothetical protein BFR36_05120 [Brochothrix thermosphacta]ODJ70372.1 hypothetical protein BFR39_06305 [Brochothrix thermosphacta]